LGPDSLRKKKIKKKFLRTLNPPALAAPAWGTSDLGGGTNKGGTIMLDDDDDDDDDISLEDHP
jgi:hypothetical protein